MADSNGKKFKGSVFGGFKRSDVLSYIERVTLEQRHALDEAKAATESALKERDAALRAKEEAETARETILTESADLRKDFERMFDESSQVKAELASVTTELSAKALEVDRLREDLTTLNDKLSAAQDEAERSRKTVQEQREKLDEYEAARRRVADIELDAFQRADKIENEARGRASEIRHSLQDIYKDAGDRFRAVNGDIRSIIDMFLKDIETSRAQITGLSDYFDELETTVARLAKEEAEKSDPNYVPAETYESDAEDINLFEKTLEMYTNHEVYPYGGDSSAGTA
ncbi:hypothetical protein LJC32_04290 [Oscillospiraceae bacterium OttesenSCG-928-F05]|nr:hypothetical protein [Oscillospiraceae bacterium OttesenSCG-928-F05]